MSATSTDELVQERIEDPTGANPPTPAPGVGGGQSGGGRDGLEEATARLRRRASLPVDRAFQVAGGILGGLGLLAIIAGWYGSAHTTRVWRQTPYLLSGGLLGVALVFVGGFAYFAFWLTRLVEQNSRQTAVLERIEAALVRQAGTDEAGRSLVATPNGTVHRPDCPVVAGKQGLRRVGPDEPGLRPCRMCEPDYAGDPATAPVTTA